ncbi:MAG TPA: hypothetical protein VJG83_05570 [archaeon]|nr:hypothetical protein [archaeon]
MGFSKQQVFSLFIAVIMVGSILGIISYTDSSNSAPLPSVPSSSVAPTTITYSASAVQGSVLQVFPTAVLIAYTTESDASAIDSKLYQVEGVLSVNNSQFVSIGDPSSNFRSEIRFSSAESAREAVDSIKKINTLSNVKMYLQALIATAQEIEFSNADLGLTQKYSFANSQVQAFVNSTTQKDDNVTITIQAEFFANNLSNSVAFEEQNLTSSEQIYFAGADLQISSLENEFFLRSFVPITSNSSLESIKSELLTKDPSGTFEIAAASAQTKIIFADPERIFEQDINTFFAGFSGVNSFSISLDQNFALVEFDSSGDYNEFKTSLRSELDSLGFEVESIEDPQQVLQGKMEYANGKQEFLSLLNGLESKHQLEIEVLQKAIISTPYIFISDSNISIPIPSGSFEAFVKPEHSAGESVSLSILVVGSERNGASEIQAQESE